MEGSRSNVADEGMLGSGLLDKVGTFVKAKGGRVSQELMERVERGRRRASVQLVFPHWFEF